MAHEDIGTDKCKHCQPTSLAKEPRTNWCKQGLRSFLVRIACPCRGLLSSPEVDIRMEQMTCDKNYRHSLTFTLVSVYKTILP
jgi:hypothetical protein